MLTPRHWLTAEARLSDANRRADSATSRRAKLQALAGVEQVGDDENTKREIAGRIRPRIPVRPRQAWSTPVAGTAPIEARSFVGSVRSEMMTFTTKIRMAMAWRGTPSVVMRFQISHPRSA